MIRENGFTIIELLMVIVIMGFLFSTVLPISYNLYCSYKTSLSANEAMLFISGVRREAFVYSERKVVASQDSDLLVDGEKKAIKGVRVHIPNPIVFYPNGSSSGGVISLLIGEDNYKLEVRSPLGDLSLMKSAV